MGHLVHVAKAARLLNVNRGKLQDLIRSGELQTFGGKLDLEELEARFPELAIDRSPIIERLELIRASAFSRRVTETVAPERDQLTSQLKKCNTARSVAEGRADKYEKLLKDVAQHLSELQNSKDAGKCEMAADLSRWLLARMNR
ncbi:hypothetical protein [Thiohalomonas denitrificans]|uniref:CDP-4-dehydro-6-deoxyglucose reductase n=1 Tax=Thiohalomonas denitrificans TaxID=415747 RepID=A0A1G5Q9D0_9GAMM|nr:hypothetical protein [Thiohalomonas denitrificans]SCZ57879.1 CDP-4-dehydro-6-deoxyglucose reductase [Thiohalomonas denitrificans]